MDGSAYSLLTTIDSFIFVSLGAAIGSYLRFKILEYLEFIFYRKYLSVAVINLSSTFLLGVTLSFLSDLRNSNISQSLLLFLCVGLLGSFSTFSTFIIDLFLHVIERKWKDFFYLLFINLFGAISLAYLGFYLING